MSLWSSTDRRRQRGDILLEALIGILLMAIIGLGLVYVTSRVAVSQKDMNLQSLAIAQLRDLLQRNGAGTDLCGGSHQISLPSIGTLNVTVTGCGTTANATVGGQALSGIASPLTLSVSNSALGGEVSLGATL
ncbi:hypothetical protein [Pseudomonas kuykendallii]|uniref:type IV pilus modification PilV family protein n=1 Tax=Pseudomonas kuykendallii TaxID=1007099 RepID=UPI0028D2BC1A|nr:hypothetical protein [Pseudomonas kuykendallii]